MARQTFGGDVNLNQEARKGVRKIEIQFVASARAFLPLHYLYTGASQFCLD